MPMRFIYLLAGLWLCACSPDKQTEPLPAPDLSPYQACSADHDCIWANNGCCDCGNGGADVAIARNQEAAFKARFDCSNVPCTTAGSDPPCGEGAVACESGRCVFRAAPAN